MNAKLELSLRNGTVFEVWSDVDQMRRLKISLARKMRDGVREPVDVRGVKYVGGERHPVDVTIMTDQLAGVQLVAAAKRAVDVSTSEAREGGAGESAPAQGSEGAEACPA